MTETERLAPSGDDGWDEGSWRGDSWRRGRDVLDTYDEDRVLCEELADDLVNELAGRAPRSRRRNATQPWHPEVRTGTAVEGRAPRRRRPRLTLVAGGRRD